MDNQPFDLKDFPFLIPLYKDRSRVKVSEKPTQLGLTIHAVLESFNRVFSGLNWLYFFPTGKLVTKFVQGRYNKLIQDNPDLALLIEKTDNLTIKRIKDAVIYFSGLGSATTEGGQFEVISVPVDGETFDEAEKMKPLFIEQAQRRMDASPHKFLNLLSTPGLPGYGIDEWFQKSDQKFYGLRCPHCNHWNIVDDPMDVDEKGKPLYFPRCIRKGFLSCLKCDRELDRHSGETIAKYPDRKDISGYHFSKLYFPRADYPGLLKRFREAKSQKEIKNFHNDDLGFPYVDLTAVMSGSEILKMCGTYTMDDVDDGPCYMGSDIGGAKGLHYVIIKPAGGDLWRLVSCGIIQEPDQMSEDVIPWLKAQYRNLVLKFRVKKLCIDGMAETRVARAIAGQFPMKAWIVWYTGQKDKYKWDDEKRQVDVNRTESLDNSHYILQNRKLLMPMRNSMIEEFADHCGHLVRELEEDEDTGVKEYVWKKIGPEDFRHALNYACLAAGVESGQKLTPSPGIVTITSESLYKPSRRLEW